MFYKWYTSVLWYVGALIAGGLPPTSARGWGFWAHKQINEKAIFTLPPELIAIYKRRLSWVREQAVTPDKRCHTDPYEAVRHYIDMEYYHAKGLIMPGGRIGYDPEAIASHGGLPWHIIAMKKALTQAFQQGHLDQIMHYSAAIAHYIADLHVPLHTTVNYDGQLTQQEGIHAFWETYLPMQFGPTYNYWVGPATYLPDVASSVWATLFESHALLGRLLEAQRRAATACQGPLFTWEQVGERLRKVPSSEFTHTYHEALDGQVERQMRAAIKMVGSVWYSCWIDAGSPDFEQEGSWPVLQKGEEEASEELAPTYCKRCTSSPEG